MRFFKVEEIDEDTFTKQGGSYKSIFVSGSQRGKDGAVYAFVDETEDEFEIYLDEFAETLKSTFVALGAEAFECSEIEDNIDDLVKEMTEVEE